MKAEVPDMIKIFIASVVYWLLILVVFIWLSRRLTLLRERIAFLEAEREEKEEEKGKNEN